MAWSGCDASRTPAVVPESTRLMQPVARKLPAGATFALILLASVSVRAQILNVEKKRIERDENEFFVGNVGANYNYNNRSPSLREPVRVLSTGLTSHLGYFYGRAGYLLINDYQLLTVNESEIVSTGFSHLRVQIERTNTLSYELFNQYQYDRPRGLRSRWLTGANGRLFLAQSEPVNVITGLGLMYETERWVDPFEADRLVQANFVKLNSYVSVRVAFNDSVDFNGIVYYQVGRDRSHEMFRHRVSSDLNLSVKLSELFSLTSSLSLAYETAPIVPVIPFIFSTTNGVRLNF